MSLTIAAISVNGIHTAIKERSETSLGLLERLKHTDSDVVLLQEVRATGDQAHKALAPTFDTGWHWIGVESLGVKGRIGVGTLSRFPLNDVQVGIDSEEFEGSGRFINGVAPAADASLDADVQIASLYLPSGTAFSGKQDKKYHFLGAFSDYLADLGAKGRDGHHAVIDGDWNIRRREQDLENWKTNRYKNGFLPQECTWMDSVFGC